MVPGGLGRGVVGNVGFGKHFQKNPLAAVHKWS